MRPHHRLLLAFLALLLALVPSAHGDEEKPLPSWRDGETRTSILEFVKAVTTKGGPHFVPAKERIAVFDNDGTLWSEQPYAQLAFILEEIQRLAPEHPEWKTTQPYKAALEMDAEYLEHDYHHGKKGLMKLLAATHMGMTQSEFRKRVRAFFETAKHPKFDRPYHTLTYQPMLELLRYLRQHGFETFIVSGGGIHFMRVVAEDIYGIEPQNVIGSHGTVTFRMEGDTPTFPRSGDHFVVNDREGKPVGIDLHIGRQPIFAAGNVRSGGDIAMLRYGQAQERKTFQLMVNHDDAEREYAYAEKDDASLSAARTHGWQVVSMKDDWAVIFPETSAPR